jgi:hypothetical protein
LLDIYGRNRRRRDYGRIYVSGGIAGWRIAIGRRISRRPIAVIAKAVTQQPHSQREAIRAITASMAVMMPVMVVSMAVTPASPRLC